MSIILYFCSKILKKIRGAAIRHSVVNKYSKIEAGSSFINSSIGKYSFCGYDCDIANADIGNYCSIANYVAIGGGRHPVEWVGTSPVFYCGHDSISKKFTEFIRQNPSRVSIGSDVWIGYRVIVMQGVTIGHGAVIGAGSVVTKDVPPYAIVAGVPAKFIKSRFSDDIVNRLLASKWWDMSDIELTSHVKWIKDPEKFLESIGL